MDTQRDPFASLSPEEVALLRNLAQRVKTPPPPAREKPQPPNLAHQIPVVMAAFPFAEAAALCALKGAPVSEAQLTDAAQKVLHRLIGDPDLAVVQTSGMTGMRVGQQLVLTLTAFTAQAIQPSQENAAP